MKKEPTDNQNLTNVEGHKHSMVCNDQLFFQELRIAAEEAERDDLDDLEDLDSKKS